MRTSSRDLIFRLQRQLSVSQHREVALSDTISDLRQETHLLRKERDEAQARLTEIDDLFQGVTFKEEIHSHYKDTYEVRVYRDRLVRETQYLGADGVWCPEPTPTAIYVGTVGQEIKEARVLDTSEADAVVACLIRKNALNPLEGKPGPECG